MTFAPAARPGSVVPLELWAGLECTLNRVGDCQRDQLALTGHYDRDEDLDRIAALGVRTIRYSVLWERVQGGAHVRDPWAWHDQRLAQIRRLGLDPIVGLVHHGSGPLTTHLLDDDFAPGLARFAREVARRYPWVRRFTPVNEPLTTARFSALYGVWHPHGRDEVCFSRALLNQIRATRLAMSAIREIRPDAELVQTEDLGKAHSTRVLAYQADFENERRWLTFDLLLGRVVPGHAMYEHMRWLGVGDTEIQAAVGDGCHPAIAGLNHYVTSERWLDDRVHRYPAGVRGGNGRHAYADVEAVRAMPAGGSGIKRLLEEAASRYAMPLAVTEAHMACTREHQLRWLAEVWDAARELRQTDIDVRAVTAWATFGAQDWASLLTRNEGQYEPGLFDVRSPTPRPTALAHMASALAGKGMFDHPVLDECGWWHRQNRLVYDVGRGVAKTLARERFRAAPRTLLITGAAGMLGSAFMRVCRERGLAARSVTRAELDITDAAAVRRTLRDSRVWGVVNAAGYTRIDGAERDRSRCFRENVHGVLTLAEACDRHGVRLMTFSSDQVFDGQAEAPYTEHAVTAPLSLYGTSKADVERRVLAEYSTTLVIRTAALFGPWDDVNFLTRALQVLAAGIPQRLPDDLVISPTYIPDLVHAALDLLVDAEVGIWNLTNPSALTYESFARQAAETGGLAAGSIDGAPYLACGMSAIRPRFSALSSERGALLPPLANALERYAAEFPWARPLDHQLTLSHFAHAAGTHII